MRDTAQEQNAPVQLLLEPSIDDPISYSNLLSQV